MIRPRVYQWKYEASRHPVAGLRNFYTAQKSDFFCSFVRRNESKEIICSTMKLFQEAPFLKAIYTWLISQIFY